MKIPGDDDVTNANKDFDIRSANKWWTTTVRHLVRTRVEPESAELGEGEIDGGACRKRQEMCSGIDQLKRFPHRGSHRTCDQHADGKHRQDLGQGLLTSTQANRTEEREADRRRDPEGERNVVRERHFEHLAGRNEKCERAENIELVLNADDRNFENAALHGEHDGADQDGERPERDAAVAKA
ncbi:MAG: hypothetical protein ACXVPP_11185 [Actinomycetota bacterium]